MKFALIIAFFLINATVRCADHFASGTDTDDSKNMDDELDRDDKWDKDDGNEKGDAKPLDKGNDKEVGKHVNNRKDKGRFVLLDFNNLFGNKKTLCNNEYREKIMKFLKLRRRNVHQATKPTTTPNPTDNCPPGFHFLTKTRTCYKVVYEEHNWTSAGQRCRDLNPKAHLAALTTGNENAALKNYLKWDFLRNSDKRVCGFFLNQMGKKLWTSGQRVNETTCESPFVWKISAKKHLPFRFSNLHYHDYWLRHDVDCRKENDHCLLLHTGSTDHFFLNAVTCDDNTICPLCEYDPK